jgi:dolichol-phosphate mannosyltransferase
MSSTIDFPTIDFTDAIDDGMAVTPRGAVAVPRPLRHRVRHGVRHPGNWFQLLRFGAVGAIGYAVNLIVFAICVHGFKVDYRLASVAAFLVSVINNFWWNRHWTFDAKEHHPAQQGVRFFAVSLVAFGFTELMLIGLVSGIGLSMQTVAQAIAVGATTPLNFLGQKLWSFKA